LQHCDAPHALDQMSFFACMFAWLHGFVRESPSENEPPLSLILIVVGVRVDLRLGPQRTQLIQ